MWRTYGAHAFFERKWGGHWAGMGRGDIITGVSSESSLT